VSAIVGAYCAAPPGAADDPSVEARWYAALRAEPLIGGLELPFTGTVHPAGPDHLAELLDPDWRSVVTDIPLADARSRADPRYGLASTDTVGRAQALEDARRLFEEVAALDERIVAVELHSAPPVRGGFSSARIFAESLTQIAQWSWADVTVCIEHVDAPTAGRPPVKGFLTLAEEIDAVKTASERSGRRIAQSVNWGRSAIEGRSALTPVENLRALRSAGTLGGLMFSGVAGAGPEAWLDAHLGMADADPGSLLTEHELHTALDEVDGAELAVFGVKMRPPATPERTARARMAAGLSALRAVERRRALRAG